MTESFFIGIGVVILLFAVFRALALWYWRVNVVVSLLTDVRDGIRGLRNEIAELTDAVGETPLRPRRPKVFVPSPAPRSSRTTTVELRRDTNVFVTPEPDGQLVDTLPAPAVVTVLEQRGEWAFVRAEDGTEGWARLP